MTASIPILIAAVVAGLAATLSASLGWPVWAMFVGWVAFTTGRKDVAGAIATYLCLLLGMGLGMSATMLISILSSQLGFYAFGVIAFLITIVVLPLRAAPGLNNPAACFLGLIACFAARLPPTFASLGQLALVGALGSLAALVSQQSARRLLHS